jgi:NTE family protein
MRACAVLFVLLTASGVADAGDDQPPSQAAQRPRLGVAFGGGSARGLAHVGVVRWFEEHHVPIDLIAGTSMGGLVGGAIASGMSSVELAALLAEVNWDEMFGFSPFRYKNIRRKDDARDYPSRIEFGMKRGVQLPVALNSGQQVDFLLARIAGRYDVIASFDDLPTPFRAVAVDLVTARQVVLERGSLTAALRATMSLPGIFPPVDHGAQVLVDGGALNNVPADVVRRMGADIVIAINVGDMRETRDINRSMLALMGQTVDVMMQVSTRSALQTADIVINPALQDFGSLDWRRHRELADEGYRAAAAMSDRLLPFALDDPQWTAYLQSREARRRSTWPVPQFVSVAGATAVDGRGIETSVSPMVGSVLDVDALESRLETFAGLDRYETIGWSLIEAEGRTGLRIDARPKAHAPPFLMLGISLQNTTTDAFAFQLAARYLAFDVLGAGSELRIDGAAGARPSAGAEWYYPLGATPLFVTASAAARRDTFPFVSDDVVVARYHEDRTAIGLALGANIGRDSDVRFALSLGSLDAAVETGAPGLPELHGKETRARLAWRYDAQDSAVVPSRGWRSEVALRYIADAPDAPPEFLTDRSNDEVTQLEFRGSTFWPSRQSHRIFVAGGAGTTWGHPFATEQFQLGAPFRLSAYDVGELRGDHYAVASAGYLRGVARLPDFLGGPIYIGGWAETGSAFNAVDDAKLRTNLAAGAVADTLVGPMLLGVSFDFSGSWRYYIAVGRLF